MDNDVSFKRWYLCAILQHGQYFVPFTRILTSWSCV